MTAAAEPDAVPRPEARLAPVMFALGFAYLLVLAGLIHRASQPEVTPLEMDLIRTALAALWPVFVIEAGVAVLRRAPGVSLRKAALRALLVVLVPPMRMGWVHPAADRIWLPRLGWRRPGRDLLRSLDRAFGGPMLLFAFLILPVLGLEYVHLVRAEAEIFRVGPEDRVFQGFSIAFDASVEEVWLAFFSGAALVVGTREMVQSGPALARMLTEAGVTVFSTVPTLLAVLEDDLPSPAGGGGLTDRDLDRLGFWRAEPDSRRCRRPAEIVVRIGRSPLDFDRCVAGERDGSQQAEHGPAEIVAEQLAEVSIRQALLQSLTRLAERLVVGLVEHQ